MNKSQENGKFTYHVKTLIIILTIGPEGKKSFGHDTETSHKNSVPDTDEKFGHAQSD